VTAEVPSVLDHAVHSRFSDPGPHVALLDAVEPTPAAVSEVARNVVVHYRASGDQLPEATVSEIGSRWVATILDRDQERHPVPLDVPREAQTRVQGCCRDFTLLSVALLRQHGIPARSRVGFAGYFVPGWHHDHVVPEVWDGGRWRRFEPEVPQGRDAIPDPLDLETGEGAGFETAAEVWRAYRAGRIDAERYGVDESVPDIRGPWMVRNYVVQEIAHRFGDELLLWDGWGMCGGPGSQDDAAGYVDQLAALLVASDNGDLDAERRLLERYQRDERLHPGPRVRSVPPLGGPEVVVDLTTRT
jgi:hypothetical protein